MDLIHPVCRSQMTEHDVEYIASVLGENVLDRTHIRDLMRDPASRDVLLDEDRLFHALLESHDHLQVSMRFYFYVLVRHALREKGIDDRQLADYVSELLAECALTEDAFAEQIPVEYVSDLIAKQMESDGRVRYRIMVYLANHCLFMTGMFAPYLRARAKRRGAPGLAYYEHTGRAGFRQAADHRLAHQQALSPLFGHLSDCFLETRRAMNDLAERLTFTGVPSDSGLS